MCILKEVIVNETKTKILTCLKDNLQTDLGTYERIQYSEPTTVLDCKYPVPPTSPFQPFFPKSLGLAFKK